MDSTIQSCGSKLVKIVVTEAETQNSAQELVCGRQSFPNSPMYGLRTAQRGFPKRLLLFCTVASRHKRSA